MTVTLNVNGTRHTSPAAPETPLLYILRNDIGLSGAKYGCGVAQCGACTVLLDGEAVRSCVTPAAVAVNRRITTIEGLGTPGRMDPLQRAFIEEQAAQCGYCSNGMIMTARQLLERVPHPSEDQIRSALANNLCRCGTHTRIIKAVQRAAGNGEL
jgi:nicotinate dehydrogenase subunit A